MFVPSPDRKWSAIGLRALVVSVVAVVALTLLDGYLKGRQMSYPNMTPGYVMFVTWVIDFRYIFEQAVYAATILFVGAKFFETRTLLTVGFDRLDHNKVTLKGPDEDNTVWIGHRYGTKFEADAVAATLAERLKQSSEAP